MFGTSFYHSTTRKVVVLFGKLFSDINVIRLDNEGLIVKTLRVPIQFGPKNQWYNRTVGDPYAGNTSPDPLQSPQKQIDTVFPRLTYEVRSIDRDASRKLASVNRQVALTSTNQTLKAIYVPMPVIIDLQLHIVANEMDDILQIIEQIIPYFTPDFNVPAQIKTELGFFSDIGFTLTYPINLEDNWAGKLENQREISISIDFRANVEFYSNVVDQPIINDIKARFGVEGADTFEDIMEITPNPSDEMPDADPVEITVTLS